MITAEFMDLILAQQFIEKLTCAPVALPDFLKSVCLIFCAEIFFDFHCSLLISACFFLFYKESEKKERDMEENEKRNVSLLFLKALI